MILRVSKKFEALIFEGSIVNVYKEVSIWVGGEFLWMDVGNKLLKG